MKKLNLAALGIALLLGPAPMQHSQAACALAFQKPPTVRFSRHYVDALCRVQPIRDAFAGRVRSGGLRLRQVCVCMLMPGVRMIGVLCV